MSIGPIINSRNKHVTLENLNVSLYNSIDTYFKFLGYFLEKLKPLRFGNKKGFAVPHNGIIFSENSEKISSH